MRAEKPIDPRRSEWMRRVARSGTPAEIRVGEALRELGAAYRRNVKSLPGSPDFANKTRKWVVFVNGCFWHHHTACRRATVPKTNVEFWLDKFGRNRHRDAKAIRQLRSLGFRVVVVWECKLADPAVLTSELSQILEPRRVDMAEAVDHRCVAIDVA